ncbi:MAG TPA: HAD family phosphatase [Thermomicrobiales bacterium]|nr:HAD family phosphatase [Thermomicrobiales bacterium]
MTTSDSTTPSRAAPAVDSGQRGVIWDMDGTLIDSARYHYESWRELLAPEGVDLDYPAFLVGFGRRNDDWLRELLGAEIALAEIRRIGDAKEERYREMLREEGLVVLPGVLDTLRALREEGWQHAVATSAPVQNLEIILEVTGLKPLMDGWAGSEDVEQGKPAPDVFLVAANHIGVAPQRAVVIEDAAAGVLGAHRAGMSVIGVGPHHAELGADRSAESLLDLPIETFAELVMMASSAR